MKQIFLCCAVMGVLCGLIPMRAAQPVLPRQDTFQAQSGGSGFSNLRIIEQSPDGTEVILAMDYSYNGSGGASAQVIPVIEKRGEKSIAAWFGADPVGISAGRGVISMKVKYFNDELGVPAQYASDRIRILILNQGGNSIIGSSMFLKNITWGDKSKPEAPVPSKDKIEEQKRKAEAEQKRLAEEKRKADEKALADAKVKEEGQRKAEAARLAEEKRLAREKELAEAKLKLDQQRKVEAEQKRLAEEKRKADEKVLAEAKAKEEEQRKAEAARLAEEKRLAREKELAEAKLKLDQQRKAEAEQKRLAEEKRKADEKALAEAKVKEEEQRKAEAARLAEEKRLAKEKGMTEAKLKLEQQRRAEAEQKRLAEEKRKANEKALADAKIKEEEQRKAEAARLAEEKRLAKEKELAEAKLKLELQLKAEAEQKRLAEEKRKADEKALAEAKLEEQRKAEAARLAEEKRLAKEKELAEAKLKLELQLKAEAEQKRLAEEKRKADEKALAEIKSEEQRKAEAARLAEEKRLAEQKQTKTTDLQAAPEIQFADGSQLKTKITNVDVVNRSLDRSKVTFSVEFEYRDSFAKPVLGVQPSNSEDPGSVAMFETSPTEIGKSRRNWVLLPIKFQPPSQKSTPINTLSTDKLWVYLSEATSQQKFNVFTATMLLMWNMPGAKIQSTAAAPTVNSVQISEIKQNNPQSGQVTVRYSLASGQGRLRLRVSDSRQSTTANFIVSEEIRIQSKNGVQILEFRLKQDAANLPSSIKADTFEVNLVDENSKVISQTSKNTSMTLKK